MNKKNTDIPLVDCPVNFLCGDASGALLNEYGRFPCKILCGVFAIIVRGTAKATINITEYEFEANDFILLEADSYFFVKEFSEDALVYYAIFSSEFLSKRTSGQQMSLTSLQLRKPIVHLSEEHSKFHQEVFRLLFHSLQLSPPHLSELQLFYIYGLFRESFMSYISGKEMSLLNPQDRPAMIYQEFCELVLKMHSKWHKVADYADAMHISLPHLSSTVNKVGNKTASELIHLAILTDAKSQLKMSNIPIKQIAIDLGFDDINFFNRFFKSKVGVTPKQYRFGLDKDNLH